MNTICGLGLLCRAAVPKEKESREEGSSNEPYNAAESQTSRGLSTWFFEQMRLFVFNLNNCW